MGDDPDTSRTAVKTYVPSYQKQEWKHHAEELDMSQSEFVRTMVQAGRRGFTGDGTDAETASESGDGQPAELADQVQEVLAAEGHLAWEGLVARLTDDIEDRLEDAMDHLQRRNRVQYDGRRGGYTLIDDGE